jgi:hypothetical protein
MRRPQVLRIASKIPERQFSARLLECVGLNGETKMQNGQENDTSLNKLRQILASRYGMGLELRTLTDVSEDDSNNGLLLKGLDLHVPLRVQDAFLGTAVVPSGADLSFENKLQVAQVIRMLLEPVLYRTYLDRQESNLKSLGEEKLETDNIRLFTEIAPTPIGEVTFEPEDFNPLVSNLIHVFGHDGQRIKKAALLLHEMTGRWAFVPFSDLSQGLESIDDLIRLGSLTLFVENIEDLPEKSQNLLMDYVSTPRSSVAPLVVTGSSMNLDQLSNSTKLSGAFRDEVQVNSLDIDRAPVTERGMREVLSLMFLRARGQA